MRQPSQRRTINRRDRNRVIHALPVLQLFRLDQIHLVEDQQSWNGVEVQFAQDAIDRGDLVFELRAGGVDQVDQQVGLLHLFQRGLERGEQVFRQVADEAHGVVDDDLLVARQPQSAAGRIERGEHSLLGGDLAVGQRVEQGAFAGVGVTDDRDHGHVAPDALDSALAPAFADVFQFVFEQRDAFAHAAAVDFELGFAGSAPADAAHQPGHLGAAAGQPRQQVLQLRQLDLNASLGGLRALGEDVQDQLRAVENLQVGGLVDGAHLGGREFAVEDDHVRAELQTADDDVVELALADQRLRVERRAALNDFVERDQAA